MNFTYNNKFQWRVDPDGMLRVTARVLADGVYPYRDTESPHGATSVGGVVMQYIPKSAFTKAALETLEGKPVIIGDHDWRTADNTHKDGKTVGAVAGTPRVKDGFVEVDLLIDDAKTVQQIMDRDLVEISSSYMGECEPKDGVYKGQAYGAVQSNLRFNHVLLLPEGAGRLGNDVRILNHNKPLQGGQTMPKTVKMSFGNRSASFTFSNEEDAAEAERMTEEQKSFDGAELEKAMNEATEVKGKLDELQAQYDAAMQTIEAQKAQIDELMSAESQSAMAQEAAAQTEAEGAILDEAIENEVLEEGRVEEIKNECAQEKTFANRRRVIVQNAMSLSAEQLSAWTQDAVDGAFETLAHTAMRNAERRSRSTMGGVQVSNSATNKSPLERILRPMRIGNSFRPGTKKAE